MRLLLDENLPGRLAQELRDMGHDVFAVRESLPGASDEEVLARAQAEGRLLLTQDKDFGELAVRYGLPSQCGVVLLRLAGSSPDADRRRVREALESRADWAGHFAVVTEDRIRMRPLPAPPSSAGE